MMKTVKINKFAVVNISRCSDVALESLPNSVHIHGDLISAFGRTVVKSLPNDLMVSMNFYALYSGLTEIPRSLVVGGDAQFAHCPIKKVYSEIIVGHLVLHSTLIESLPDNMHIYNSLNLAECVNLEKLPMNMQVDGEINICGCQKLNDIPNDIRTKRIKYDRLTGFYKDKNKLQEIRRRFLNRIQLLFVDR